MSKKFTSTVSGASIFIASFGFISKGIGFLREILYASLFGLSENFDIYLIGAVLPLTLNVIIICLGQNYLIPFYNKLKENDIILSKKFIQTNFFIFIGGGIILSGLLYLLSDAIISSYFQSTDSDLKITAINIFNLFLITIPLTCGISVITAYMQSNFEFKYPVFSQLLVNIIVLLIVYLFKDLNIFAIPVGYIIGTVVQFIILLVKSKEVFFKTSDFVSLYGLYKNSISFSIIIIILIESIGQLYLISDRYFFNSVTKGGISALNYSFTVFLLPLSIISIALSTAIFPKFSKLFSKKLSDELEKVFNDGIVVNIFIFTPIMFLFLFYGEAILKIIFERGEFSGIDTITTSKALFFYSLSIVFYASYSILNKIIYSAGLIEKLLYITLGGITVKILLNFLLVKSMQQNGLALSTSISFIFFFFTSLILIYKRFSFRNKTIFFKEFIFHFFNGFISLFIVKQLSFIYQSNSSFFLVEIFLFITIYILNLFLFKTTSSQIINELFKNIKNTLA